MATANPLDELRRRLGHGTAPGAFAALAEEHRRAGRLDEAVAVCRDGLARYPSYASARVTLGRALLDLGDVDGALDELGQAVAQAPDNLAAARALDTALALASANAPAVGTHDAATHDAPVDAPTADAPADLGDASLAWLLHADDPCDEDVFASEWTETATEAVADAPGAGLDDWPMIAVTHHEGGPPSTVAPDTWGTSVDAVVAEVFARASGDGDPEAAPGAADAADAGLTPLDTLQTLLEAIRARRSALASVHSDVD